MASIESVTLEVADPAAAEDFYRTAFGLTTQVNLRASEAPSTGFRGYTLSLTVPQPANASALIDAALGAGASTLKPAAKSFWGFGGVVQAPDGAIWKIATSEKKDSRPASKQFYVESGLEVAKSYGRKYVEFTAPGPVKLALYGYKALAKDAGVPAEGSGSHRLAIDSDAGSFTDLDGFTWEKA